MVSVYILIPPRLMDSLWGGWIYRAAVRGRQYRKPSVAIGEGSIRCWVKTEVGITPLWGWRRTLEYVEVQMATLLWQQIIEPKQIVNLSSNKINLIHLPRPTSMILKLQCASQPLEGLLKAQIATPAPQVSDLAGLGNLHSHGFPGDIEAAGQGPHFKNH